jgi:hypothetical protein
MIPDLLGQQDPIARDIPAFIIRHLTSGRAEILQIASVGTFSKGP